MEAYKYRLVGVGHSQSHASHVLVTFERQEGTRFGVVLATEDAQRLSDDLREQIRIAAPEYLRGPHGALESRGLARLGEERKPYRPVAVTTMRSKQKKSDSEVDWLATHTRGAQDPVDRFLAQLGDPGMRHAYKWGLNKIIGCTKDALKLERKPSRQHELQEQLLNLGNHLREAIKLMRRPAIENALRYAHTIGDMPMEMNTLANAIPRAIERLHLTGRHGNVLSTHAIRLPAKIYMTVLTIRLIQSASGKSGRPGRGNGLLLELLQVLWEIAGGNGAVEWERAIRTATGTPNPEMTPAYVSAYLEAADLVEDIYGQTTETPTDECTLRTEIKRRWGGPIEGHPGAEGYDTPEEYLRFMRENGLRFAPKYKFAEGEGD
jgi:hypothetical protein